MSSYEVLVVGAGLAGATMAERLATIGKRVLVIDRRPHIAGNAYDYYDAYGILVHRYGPHIFHTNSDQVFRYLSRFTDWYPYVHRALTSADGKLLPFPINRTTINALYGLALSSDEEVESFFASRAEPNRQICNSEDRIVARVGWDLYKLFYRGYTRKVWGRDPSRLAASVCGRIPIRYSDDTRWFADRWQGMPSEGYTAMVAQMLAHPNIDVRVGTDYSTVADAYEQLVWTGCVDQYFDYRYGRLPYRSLRFEPTVFATPTGTLRQSAGIINYPSETIPWIRKTEYRHLTGQRAAFSTVVAEYPAERGEPFYPIPCADAQALYARYKKLADGETNVVFVGRLARYQYLNMDQVVAQALKCANLQAWRGQPCGDGS